MTTKTQRRKQRIAARRKAEWEWHSRRHWVAWLCYWSNPPRVSVEVYYSPKGEYDLPAPLGYEMIGAFMSRAAAWAAALQAQKQINTLLEQES